MPFCLYDGGKPGISRPTSAVEMSPVHTPRSKAVSNLRMKNLTDETSATPRMIRQYIQRGLMPHATGRGTGPVYNDNHLVRLRAIRSLLSRGYGLDQIRKRLDSMTPEDLARLGAPPLPPSAEPPTTASSPAVTPFLQSAEPWERIELVPGLELHARSNAGPLVRRLAEEIAARYSAAVGPKAT